MEINEKTINIDKNKSLIDAKIAEDKILNDDKLTDKEKISLIKTLKELISENNEEVLLGWEKGYFLLVKMMNKKRPF